MRKELNILVVDDEKNIRKVMDIVITDMGHKFYGAENPEAASDMLKEKEMDMIILDIKMPKMDGMEYLKLLNMNYPDIPVIMLSGHGTISNAVEALKIGAADFIEKNGDEDVIYDVISRVAANLGSKADDTFAGFLYRDKKMARIIKKIRALNGKNINILINGESGVGKEIVARYIHASSARASGPFVPVDCGAVPVNLFESEMFGYEQGAFTGASRQKKGKIEMADGGTLFLDEICNLKPQSQVSLLRVLQERSFYRLGGKEPVNSEFGLISASNTDLMSASGKNEFREDLYFRINVMEIYIPPLRERRDDIMPLSNSFLHEFKVKYGGDRKYIHPDLESYLLNYTWPGNVRELKNFMERLYIMTESDTLYFNEEYLVSMQLDIATMLRRNERDILERILAITGGDLVKSAKALNIEIEDLKKRMSIHEIFNA